MKYTFIYRLSLQMTFNVLIYLVTATSLFSQTDEQLVLGQQPVYKVSRAREPVTVDDRFRSTSTLFPVYDIRKDVHQPSRFGLLEFTDK